MSKKKEMKEERRKVSSFWLKLSPPNGTSAHLRSIGLGKEKEKEARHETTRVRKEREGKSGEPSS